MSKSEKLEFRVSPSTKETVAREFRQGELSQYLRRALSDRLEGDGEPDLEQYEQLLATILDHMERGMLVDSTHGRVQRAAEVGRKRPSAVVDELKQRAHGRRIDESQFTRGEVRYDYTPVMLD